MDTNGKWRVGLETLTIPCKTEAACEKLILQAVFRDRVHSYWIFDRKADNTIHPSKSRFWIM